MIEYIFFDATLRDRFVEHAQGLGVDCAQREDGMGLVVAVPEDLPEAVEAAIEACYDALQEEQVALTDATDEDAQRHLAGFRVALPDGQHAMVPLSPDIANRLLDGFSLDEIHDLFATVAKYALNPQDVSVCRVIEED
jgi:hypothetical protein